MARFVYHYIDAGGRRRWSWQKAGNAAACSAQLAEGGIYPIFMLCLQWPSIFAPRGLPSRQLALFFRQLAMALSSGVPLLEALHHMAREQSSERQRAFIVRLETQVLSGKSFSKALQQEKGLDPMLAHWLAIGEKQGRLAQILGEVHRYLEERERLKKRIQQQLIYPMVVLLAVLVIGALLSLVVMPMLARQFMGFEANIPAPMRFFLLLHDVFRAYGGWLLLALALAAGLMLVVRSRRLPQEQRVLKRLVLAWPFLRSFSVLRVYVPFARLFGQMLRSGVPVGEAMQSLQQCFRRSLFAEDMAAVAAAMTHGGHLSQALADASFVPELARQMLLNGECYGRLPEALADSAAYYETILFEKLGLWIRFVEPLAIVLLGLLVLFMALGLFVPVLESYQSLLVQ